MMKIRIPIKRIPVEKLSVKKRLKRDMIVEAAGKTFSRYGYKNTTMNKIAITAKIAKSSMYYYFKGKKEIFNSVIFKESQNFRKKALTAIKKGNSPQEKLKLYILTRLQSDKIIKNFNYALNAPKLISQKFVRRLKKIHDEEELRIFKNILQEGINNEFFEVHDINLATVAFVTATRGVESMTKITLPSSKIENNVENILNIIMYGIVKR